MNRIEALNILGLDDDATAQDIRTAYKECAQILHPDRFAGNKKLQERATEQFKRLQDAYEFCGRAAARRRRAERRRLPVPFRTPRRSLQGWRRRVPS